MKLEVLTRNAMVDAVDTLIGTGGVIDFYNTTSDIPTTGMLQTNVQLSCANPAMAAATNGIGTFDTITADTVANTGTDGTVRYFALKKATDSTISNVICTGSVLTQTADITFNTTSWDVADNVSITSLTFTQPAGT